MLQLINNKILSSNNYKQDKLALRIGKTSPTVKLADQLTAVATLTAVERGPWENSSAT